MRKSTYTLETDRKLTPHQTEILRLVGRGLSNKEIGELLILQENSVRCHVVHIKKALNLEERLLPLYALKKNLALLSDIKLPEEDLMT